MAKKTKISRSIEKKSCFHCGLPCPDETQVAAGHFFCCQGCRTIYELLEANQLCQYYRIQQKPGISQKGKEDHGDRDPDRARFQFLEDETLQQQLLDYHDGTFSKVTFDIPTIHCSSCIWLLENLPKLAPHILASQVNFLQKKVAVTFRNPETSLREIVELLSAIGYEPCFSLDSTEGSGSGSSHKSLYLKIGVAGFCFGNIMLLSFPEYLAVGDTLDPLFKRFFGGLNIVLALPVLLYSASDYLISGYRGLQRKMVNIDVPLSIGILAFFGQSLYEILSHTGAGYMDSFAGLIFLLLIGRIFQHKTYESLSFERNYKAFFPISVSRREGERFVSMPLARLAVGDRILIRHQEIIPADSILLQGQGMIDYSFVTGEADPRSKKSGDRIYAGGKQTGSAIELEVVKAVSQSYLTQLWNTAPFQRSEENQLLSFVNMVSRYFTVGILCVAILTACYWSWAAPLLALKAFVSVLIIACPCALALSAPFTLGNTLRIFGRNQFYLKNTNVVEKLAAIQSIVFDKTGTLTRAGRQEVQFVAGQNGGELNEEQKSMVRSLVKHSTHPLSFKIFNALTADCQKMVENYQEIIGKGLQGEIAGHSLKMGAREYVKGGKKNAVRLSAASEVWVAIDHEVKGCYQIERKYRPGLAGILKQLQECFKLALISGDNASEKKYLAPLFGRSARLLFEQSPQDKLNYIRQLQEKGQQVLMIGDGLNDAGALKQSDVGITVSEDLNSFSPACDGILKAGQFSKLPRFLQLTRTAMNVIRFNLGISLLYNLVGLSFAVQGKLSPLFCAILMPLSSVTVICSATILTTFWAYMYGMHIRRPEHPSPGAGGRSEIPGRLMNVGTVEKSSPKSASEQASVTK